MAREMKRFPTNTWLDSVRGCGCVIGEYLVATAPDDRAAIARRVRLSGAVATVQDLLEDNPYGDLLMEFGTGIDRRVTREIDEEYVDAVVIVDGNDLDGTFEFELATTPDGTLYAGSAA